MIIITGSGRLYAAISLLHREADKIFISVPGGKTFCKCDETFNNIRFTLKNRW